MPAEEFYYQEAPGYPSQDENADEGRRNEAEPAARELFKKAIKVVAVGGGGGNALNHIISRGIEGVDMLAVNTDLRSLDMSLCETKLVLGERVTKGLGAGALPDIGAKAAMESIEDIRRYLKGADMVYLAAGMGGGTGTGALPIIARAAREMGILTVAVVTRPFSFEGKRRRRYAEEGIEKLMPEVDALIVVPNDRLLDLSHKNTPLSQSFLLADEILRQAVQGVTDLITRPGMVNVDFADLKSVMANAGRSVMGIGTANGEDALVKAVKSALESPLMECSMQGAKGVLMNITYKEELPLYEISRAAAAAEDFISEEALFIWGCVEDAAIENDVEVTLVAAGFDETEGTAVHESRAAAPQKSAERAQAEEPAISAAPLAAERTEPQKEPERPLYEREVHIPEWLLAEEPESEPEKLGPTVGTKPSVYDIYESPAFVRRGRVLKRPQ
ncbi:MAG: cell division protein FtsZ [Synergistaceae bacterium]|nr:cell division protein FtsZ [Synergistaceae bacterium]